jgi:hypothetical protein
MMESIPRHQCLIYDGAPSQLLPELAAVTQKMLLQHYRCLYLNSQPMVAGMRSYLAATGVDVAHETTKRVSYCHQRGSISPTVDLRSNA